MLPLSASFPQDFPGFFHSLVAFGAVGVPTAVVNSALKYMQKKIELAFQVCAEVWKVGRWRCS